MDNMDINIINPVVHITQRGIRGLPIVRDESDKYRFLKMLYYVNDINRPSNWERDVDRMDKSLHFNRPKQWRNDREPFIEIFSYCLMPNHFHIIAKEREKNGIPRFMQRLSNSMAKHFNLKYNEKGSLFQGKYKSTEIKDDDQLLYTTIYVNVKNPFEMYTGGINNALQRFNDAYTFALNYPFCSLKDIVGQRNSPIISNDLPIQYSPNTFKKDSKDLIEGRQEIMNVNI